MPIDYTSGFVYLSISQRSYIVSLVLNNLIFQVMRELFVVQHSSFLPLLTSRPTGYGMRIRKKLCPIFFHRHDSELAVSHADSPYQLIR